MPNPGDASKTPQQPDHHLESGPSRPIPPPATKSGSKKSSFTPGESSREGGTRKKTSTELSHHHKRRGVATPSSMMVLHRKGYILDSGNTLGTGAYAKVKIGTSLKMNIQVAIKIVNKLATPKEVVQRFLPREIETMKAVSNEHIIKLYEVIETPETIFFVMELADKGDLLDFINERKYLSERLARGFFSDLVKGVDHCHSRGVVHRDLKCENLLLDSHMRLKISDFGFARKFDGNLKTFCGSFAYAAPEVILGNPYNGPLADIWSMGVILYAMVTGRLPFKDTSTSVLMADIAAGVKFSSRHTEKLKTLIVKILTFLPHERADMAYIQNHPWINVPLSFNIQSNPVSERPEVPRPKARGLQEIIEADQKSKHQSYQFPPKSRGKSSGYISSSGRHIQSGSGRHSSTGAGGVAEFHPRYPSASGPSKEVKTKSKAEHAVAASSGPGGTVRNHPLLESSEPKPPKSRSNTFPVAVLQNSQPQNLLTPGSATNTDSESGDPPPNHGHGHQNASRVLDTKTAFHSVSRYETNDSASTA